MEILTKSQSKGFLFIKLVSKADHPWSILKRFPSEISEVHIRTCVSGSLSQPYAHLSLRLGLPMDR
jgi:hypothetical protein